MNHIEKKWNTLKNSNMKELFEIAKEFREKLPYGTKIRLIEMVDDPQPVKPGTYGEITSVDDLCQIQVNWQTGSSLALIPGIDRFEVIEIPSN